uniref:Uncharacterized protein n=1 Tax=Kalanchoe fedtschenkoi TaxID=63787 RepID=A0A7N0ZZT9_KALFE
MIVRKNRGPAPWVPLLTVGGLGLIICGPTLYSIVMFLLPLFCGDGEESGIFSALKLLILALLLLLIHILAVFFPNLCSSYSASLGSPGSDYGGFGVGSVIMVVLFFILYNLL